MTSQNGLVQRLWSYCNILRDDGLSYGDRNEAGGDAAPIAAAQGARRIVAEIEERL